jgi:RNA polymerase sigma-70 factor (ECF subfamily)
LGPQRAGFEKQSPEELAIAAQRGCRASFEEIVQRTHGPLLAYLRRLAGSREDAEDLVQETLIRAYRKLNRFRPDWRLSTWLFTVARRLWLNDRRRGRIQVAAEDAADHVVSRGESDPAASLIAEEERQQLWQVAADVLTEPQYTALWLFYVEDLPVADVGRVLRRTPGSVKAVLHRARRRLLAELLAKQRQPAIASAGAHSGTQFVSE